jgi:hypothetical protein
MMAYLRVSVRNILAVSLVILIAACSGPQYDVILINPYEDVDWENVGHYKAGLHEHTLQSDGYHMVDKVVRAYPAAGFSILALTDHDMHPPNTQVRWGNLDEKYGTHLPADPNPDNYPANTTWPWNIKGNNTTNSTLCLDIQVQSSVCKLRVYFHSKQTC